MRSFLAGCGVFDFDFPQLAVVSCALDFNVLQFYYVAYRIACQHCPRKQARFSGIPKYPQWFDAELITLLKKKR